MDHLGFILGSCWQPFGSQHPFWVPVPLIITILISHHLIVSPYHHLNMASSHHLITLSLLHNIISSSLHLIFISRSSQHLLNISLSRYYVISAPHDLDISTPITQQPTTNNSTPPQLFRFFVSSFRQPMLCLHACGYNACCYHPRPHRLSLSRPAPPPSGTFAMHIPSRVHPRYHPTISRIPPEFAL